MVLFLFVKGEHLQRSCKHLATKNYFQKLPRLDSVKKKASKKTASKKTASSPQCLPQFCLNAIQKFIFKNIDIKKPRKLFVIDVDENSKNVLQAIYNIKK